LETATNSSGTEICLASLGVAKLPRATNIYGRRLNIAQLGFAAPTGDKYISAEIESYLFLAWLGVVQLTGGQFLSRVLDIRGRFYYDRTVEFCNTTFQVRTYSGLWKC
jgi:hypothetical protein